jgi:hypothetical protein
MSAKMNPEIKAEWLAALRSGEYQQGRGRLRHDYGDQPEFCCLGVLCDLLVKRMPDGFKWKEVEGDGLYISAKEDSRSSSLPKSAMAASGINHRLVDIGCTVEFDGRNAACLTELNDAGMPFPEIADIIEKHL